MAGIPLLSLTPFFGAATVAVYLVSYAQAWPTAVQVGGDAVRVVTESVVEPVTFACLFFTLATAAFRHLASARPTGRVLLTAGLLTTPYLAGLWIAGSVNPAPSLADMEYDAFTGHYVAPIPLDWSPPTLTVILAAAALTHVCGVLRLAKGRTTAPAPRAARLLFGQPAWYAAYLVVCAFGIWFTSVTTRPATDSELHFGGSPGEVVGDAWRLLTVAAVAMVVLSALMTAMGVAARRGHALLHVLTGIAAPSHVLLLATSAIAAPLGPITMSARVAEEIRPIWHLPLLAALACGALAAFWYALRRAAQEPTRHECR
ncbi:hypothetical protein [Nonomuraea longicatena]|uniref:Uncharacterized protein n=1 Tax=Nonomuraea longicatena TaxID=83682 RepID=A0ABP3ZY76_9ACTN